MPPRDIDFSGRKLLGNIGRPSCPSCFLQALLASAGRGLGGSFLDQNFARARHVIDTNILGTEYLVHLVGADMRGRGEGKIELKDAGVSVSCLMPGATETEFFRRADMLDTPVGQAKKDDAAEVARVGSKAMMSGDGDVVSGWRNNYWRHWRILRRRRCWLNIQKDGCA